MGGHIAEIRYFQITADEVSIEEKIDFLKQRIGRCKSIAFRDLFDPGSTVRDLIATFLALLEILRLGLATVRQSKSFSDIWIRGVAKENVDGGAEEDS